MYHQLINLLEEFSSAQAENLVWKSVRRYASSALSEAGLVGEAAKLRNFQGTLEEAQEATANAAMQADVTPIEGAEEAAGAAVQASNACEALSTGIYKTAVKNALSALLYAAEVDLDLSVKDELSKV